MFLSKDESGALMDAVKDWQECYGRLCKLAQAKKQMLWGEVPKMHFYYHLAQQGKFMNPKMFWTYMSEDFVGKMSKLAHSLLHSNKIWNVSRKVAEKYCMALHFWLAQKWPEQAKFLEETKLRED